MILWENKIWRLSLPQWNNSLPFIENKIDGFCDYPCYYGSFRIGLNYPERVPKYVKVKISEYLSKHFKK